MKKQLLGQIIKKKKTKMSLQLLLISQMEKVAFMKQTNQ